MHERDVKARIVDIRTYVPRAGEKFFVDTNVWYWTCYTKASSGSPNRQPRRYQTKTYPEFIMQALMQGAQLFTTSLTFAELAHLVESKEYDIYHHQNQSQQNPLNRKAFRYHKQHRERVVAEVRSVWDSVLQYCTDNFLDSPMQRDMCDKAYQRFGESLLDGYDIFFIEIMLKHQITAIITDDKDFISVPNITVFTANNAALKHK